jgi:hypothetical protein
VGSSLFRIGTFLGITFAAAGGAGAVVIPVTYQGPGWVAEGVPVAVATGTTGMSVHNIGLGRRPTQTFTTTSAFTLDKIWIKYHDVQPGMENYVMEVRLFKIANAQTPVFNPAPADMLFTEPQIHHLPATASNNLFDNYAIFDVENVALDANSAYAFQFVISGSGPTYAYRWIGGTGAGGYAGGVFYRQDNPSLTFGTNEDRFFALQPLVVTQQPNPPAEAMPEPAAMLLIGVGSWAVGLGRRRPRER